MQEFFEHRGDRNEIVVQDLLEARHASILKCDIDEHNLTFTHDTQCGCAKGRGTCMAGQIVEVAANFSKGRGRCCGRLHLDPSVAFDSILREFLDANSTCNVRLMQSALKALNVSDGARSPLGPSATCTQPPFSCAQK